MALLLEVGSEISSQDGFEEVSVEEVTTEALGVQDIDAQYHEKFLADVLVYAQECVDRFFAGKELYGGGPIPRKYLRSPRRLDLVMNANMLEGIPYAYYVLRRDNHSSVEEDAKTVTVPKDIKLILTILNHCKSLAIPKEYACGMMLVYLELCEGVSIVGQ